ncbi:hypothetical protein GGR53DRAFT_532321 [Hypoxylon sp. FL1150]|nr:hypothetical protein GGR53DRAFT_532321 [Hypoxylon sp. FL1150]
MSLFMLLPVGCVVGRATKLTKAHRAYKDENMPPIRGGTALKAALACPLSDRFLIVIDPNSCPGSQCETSTAALSLAVMLAPHPRDTAARHRGVRIGTPSTTCRSSEPPGPTKREPFLSEPPSPPIWLTQPGPRSPRLT